MNSAGRIALFGSVLLFLPLFISLSCKGMQQSEISKCEENCEYSKRDCVENCGGYNTFGFSIDFSKSGFSSPYACTGRCEAASERCLKLCEDQTKADE
ncbi:MAG: hypothetical protein CVV49_04305 [Spirochaetae bacterium HGW-Spirochaetae-5]|nr:MAG: hypothetical protein CVV49_04305 [Spirochaetae bacterium HGW-Spirochaetae-5]